MAAGQALAHAVLHAARAGVHGQPSGQVVDLEVHRRRPSGRPGLVRVASSSCGWAASALWPPRRLDEVVDTA